MAAGNFVCSGADRHRCLVGLKNKLHYRPPARIVPGISVQMADNSKEIQRISNMLGEQQSIKETIKGLDVLRYKVDDLVKQMDRINERNLAIEEQHANLFKALQQQGPQQQAQIKGGYAYE